MRTIMVFEPQSMSFRPCDDVLARLLLVVGRDRVLEVEKDDVGAAFGRLLEQRGVRPRHGKLGTVKARGRLLDQGKAHSLLPPGLACGAETGGNGVDGQQQARICNASRSVSRSAPLKRRRSSTCSRLTSLMVGQPGGKRARDTRGSARRCPTRRSPSAPSRLVQRKLGLDQRENIVAHACLGDEARIVAGDVEIDEEQRLLDLVDDQAEQARGLEHAPAAASRPPRRAPRGSS